MIFNNRILIFNSIKHNQKINKILLEIKLLTLIN